jgi:2-desacetyl-2-hydroxyethyl bacteriochlorophyllide A dehydrogenase
MPRAHAVVFEGVDRVGLAEIELPDPLEGEVLVRIEATGVSAGTELRALAGRQHGAPDFPFVPGYSAAGVVVGGPHDGRRVWAPGTRRASISLLWGGHVGWAVAPWSACVELPESVGFEEGSVAAQAAIARRGLVMAELEPADRTTVIGLGPIGLASLIQAVGRCDVCGWDLNPARRAYAEGFGLPVREPEPDTMDVVIDATGAPGALASSLALLATPSWHGEPDRPPRLVIQGSYPGSFELDYHAAFTKQCSILLPRDKALSELKAALGDAAQGRFSLKPLIPAIIPWSEAPSAYGRLQRGEIPGAIFDWSAA